MKQFDEMPVSDTGDDKVAFVVLGAMSAIVLAVLFAPIGTSQSFWGGIRDLAEVAFAMFAGGYIGSVLYGVFSGDVVDTTQNGDIDE